MELDRLRREAERRGLSLVEDVRKETRDLGVALEAMAFAAEMHEWGRLALRTSEAEQHASIIRDYYLCDWPSIDLCEGLS